MICEAPQKSPAEQEIDDLLDFLKDEDYSRAVGSVNTAYEEFRNGLDQINKNKKAGFISEVEAARQEVKLYERLSSQAQKAYQNVLDDMPKRYDKNNQEAIRKRALLQKQQSDLQKAINAHKANGTAFAKKAIEATKNAEISGSKIVGSGAIKTFSSRATAAIGVISMGDAWRKGFETGDFNDVGRTSASFLGGYGGAIGGAKLGTLMATLAFGAATGGVGWAIMAGAAIVGAAGGWYGSKWAENCWDAFDNWRNPTYRSNKSYGYDPLVLNLDGTGIQTLIASKYGARFDHNADGIATATGWTAAGNGILALDLNNNGKIDSGKEIFGNHTVLSNGATAAHGYAALAELDSNADGMISALDNAFDSLKVWQDINQDGISQANELFTLQALGIQSLNLEHQENSKDLGNGNRLTHIGSYTKTDGTTGEMGDVEFAANRLYSRYTDTVELTPEQLQAPNLQGLGRLRNLRLVTLNYQ